MPKRLPIKETIKFTYAYRIGERGGEDKYYNLMEGVGQLIDMSSSVRIEAYGSEASYNAVMLVEEDKNMRLVDRFTKLWVSNKPISQDEQSEYRVVLVPRAIDGIIKIYLSSITENNKDLWYLYNGDIYRIEAWFDENSLEAHIPNNMFLPIDKNTKFWYIEPVAEEDTDGLIYLKDFRSKDNYSVLKFKE